MTRMLLHSAALCVWVAAFGCMLLAVTAVALWAFSQEGPSQIRWVLLNLTIVPVVTLYCGARTLVFAIQEAERLLLPTDAEDDERPQLFRRAG